MPSAVPSPTQPVRSWHPLFAAVILVLAAFAAYHNSFSGPFLYDDGPAIKENPTIRQLWPLSTVLSPPNDSGVTVNGRPLVNLSLALNYALGGTEVRGYHVLNLAIHIFAGLTLFGLVRRSLQLPTLQSRFPDENTRLLLALTVALLWTLHPLQTESVTYVIQRAESLVGLFYLLTFYCFVRSVSSSRPAVWQASTVVACLCGMASKEVMASAPLLVLLYDRALVSGSFSEAWRRHQRIYFGLAATWVLLGVLMAGTGNRGGTAGFGAGGVSSWDYALTSALAIGKYLKLTVWPSPLVFDYGTAVETRLLPVLPQGIMIVALVAATFYALWRHPVLGFLGIWFFAILGPSSSIIPIATETMAEHRMYLALVPLIALAVLGLVPLLGRRSVFAFLALAVGAGWLTYQRNEDYRDDLRLWRDTQQKYPSNSRAHNNVGEALSRQDKLAEAIEAFREAVRLLPNYVDAIDNLGNTLTQLGRPAEALPLLERALRLKPGYAPTYNNLGNALYNLKRPDEALSHFVEAIRLKPEYGEAHNNLAVVLTDFDRAAEAIPHLQDALRYKENYADAHYNLGNALTKLGREAEAVDQFRTALQLKPTHAEANNNLGGVLFRLGKTAEAKTLYETAVRLKPDYADAQNNLGVALFKEDRVLEAFDRFATAVRLNADYQDARKNLAEVAEQLITLGAVAFQSGKMEEARRYFQAVVSAIPTHASAQNNLGVTLWRLGKPTEALPHLEEAVRLKPDYVDAQRGLAGLKQELRKSGGIPPQ